MGQDGFQEQGARGEKVVSSDPEIAEAIEAFATSIERARARRYDAWQGFVVSGAAGVALIRHWEATSRDLGKPLRS